MGNKENFQRLSKRLMIALAQYQLNRFMHPLLSGSVYNEYSRMWNMILLGLEMSFLQGLHNVISKPKYRGQFSIHSFVPDFESKHTDLVGKIAETRHNSLSHLNEKVKSSLDETDYKNIQNIFDEVVELVNKEAPKYLEIKTEVDIRKIYKFESREATRDFLRLMDNLRQEQ